ncbi:MAG TPA: tripartite tricarboxylate transporter substrate binding protein [Burkholderiaceae bacterium]|nr:tripartite tricarboxylate transporter substrate binding protein [Burkholderiaceae bacterium]
MSMSRRQWVIDLAALTVGAPFARARAETFPSHVITLWVPWAAGGATDISLRVLAELASRHLGQRVITENRAGAGGTLAMPILQQAEPDGYTIAQLPQPIFHAYFTQKVTWHPINDVTPIIQVSGVTFGLLVEPGSPFKTFDDLIAFARARPGELSIATNGVGTSPHLALEEIFTSRGLSYIHVPYKGVSEQVNAVAAGQVMAGVSSTGFGPAVDAGKLRLLAVFSARRSRRWPDVPTLKDLGYDIVAQSPFGIGGPRGMPENIVSILHDCFRKAVSDPIFGQELAKYDQEVDYLGPAEYAQSRRALFAKERAYVEKLKLARDGAR